MKKDKGIGGCRLGRALILGALAGFLGVGIGLPCAAAKELRVGALFADPPGIDPFAQVGGFETSLVRIQYADPLIFIGDEGEIVPALATSWKQIAPTQWELTLRKGVRFHNGEVFDSGAVKFNLEMMLDPKIKAYNTNSLRAIKGVLLDPADPYKVIIETHSQNWMFPRQLFFANILPPKMLREEGLELFRTHPVGTGPFRFVEWKKGKELVYERNKDYWNPGLPKVDRMRLLIAPKAELLKGFKEGTVDLLLNMDGRFTREVMESGNAQIIKRLSQVATICHLNNRGPLALVDVRRALNYALDKDEMIRFADYGNAVALASLAPQGAIGKSDVTPYPYDLKKAKELLAKTPYKKGFRLKLLTGESSETIAKIMRVQLRQLGVELDIEVAAGIVYRIAKDSGPNGELSPNYDLMLNQFGTPIVDISHLVEVAFASNGPSSILREPSLDQMFINAHQVSSAQEYEHRLREIDRYFHDQALSLFTTQRIVTVAARKGMKLKIPLSGNFAGSDALARIEVQN